MIVTIIIVLVVGFVSVSSMKTDLLPNLELPYIAVVTTEAGASPKQVEADVTKTMESALGTISGVEKLTSTSSTNYGMVLLTFSDDTDMDSALVRVSKAVNTMDLPDECGTPNILELSMDMVATLYANINYDGKNIKELSSFCDNTVIPYLERQDGVARVSANGLINDSIEIKLNKSKINRINAKILSQTNKKLAKASDKITSSQNKLSDSKNQLYSKKASLSDTKKKTSDKLSNAMTQLTKAQASKAAAESTLLSLKASKSALEAEKKAYKDAKLEDAYNTLDAALAALNQNMGAIAATQGITVPSSVEEAIKKPSEYNKFIEWMNAAGYGAQVKQLSLDTLKQTHKAVKVRLPQIDTEIANLNTEIKAQEAIVAQIKKKVQDLDQKQTELNSAQLNAAIQIGQGEAQLSSAESQIKNAEKQLSSAEKKLENSIEAARDNSNINALLSIDTLSGIISAQNFSMPAGYVEDKNDDKWLVEVKENFENEKQINNLVLTKLDGVGKIRLKDVADVTTIDNIGEAYCKVNGKDAVMLSIYKASTANTSDVSNKVNEAFSSLEAKYKGLGFTQMMNQGDYISIIINSVLTSILLGAVLAIIVLALFLKSIKPTIVVAFSIPFSVLFALIIMYFTKINLNVMSLAGLCISIGMLVDNSVVVMENIFRMRQKGIPAPRAAVQGTKQVAGPIIASTATTICVFLPMVYTTGIVAQLLIPFAFTISYALIASLIVALTVVPTIGSLLLKKSKPRKENWFDKLKNLYGKALAFSLKYKFVPLGAAIILLALMVVQTFSTGMATIDQTESNQISVTLTLEDGVKKNKAYKTADQVLDRLMKIKGINKISALDGSTGVMSTFLGSGVSEDYSMFTFNVITDDDVKTTEEYRRIRSDIEKQTKGIDCKSISASSSAMSSMSSLAGDGVTVNIYGDDEEKLIEISKDVMKLMKGVKGIENASNGITDADKTLRLRIDRNKAAECGLTVAQIFQQIAQKTTTKKTAATLNVDDKKINVDIVDETNKLTYENILSTKITSTQKNSSGKDVTKTYRLSKFASVNDGYTMSSITRENQRMYLKIESETAEGENTALLSREVENKLKSYKTPAGYEVAIAGSAIQTEEMLNQMLRAILLGFVLIYLIMVAQFQSFLSPFIIIFTVPLAFTGGMIGLGVFGMTISAMSLMGFMILMGTVVNNGIVFVDYANKLRIKGIERRRALIETGKTRMRPILMTALTTILSMSVMVFSQDAGNAMQRSMAVVVSVGLLYSTLMTLFVVPVLYDIFYRKAPKVIDVGDDLDDEADETADFVEELRVKN